MSNQNSENREGSNLPDFMSEKNKFSYVEDAETENSWLNNNLHRLMIWVSVIWFAVVVIYITQFFGWSNLFLMMPDEFGGFLAGVTLPLAIIWVVMAYIDRGSSFKREAKFLRAYMNQLVYPEEGSATTAKAMADAIRSQVIELQEVTKLATAQTEKIKQELGGRVDRLCQACRRFGQLFLKNHDRTGPTVSKRWLKALIMLPNAPKTQPASSRIKSAILPIRPSSSKKKFPTSLTKYLPALRKSVNRPKLSAPFPKATVPDWPGPMKCCSSTAIKPAKP